jgi:hypothetical protein
MCRVLPERNTVDILLHVMSCHVMYLQDTVRYYECFKTHLAANFAQATFCLDLSRSR